MKKKINLILLASSFALLGTTACNPTTNDNGKGNESSTVAEDGNSLAKAAWNAVATQYSDWSSDGLTGDQDLVVETSKKSTDGTVTYKYKIVYTVAESYASCLRISEDGKKLYVICPNSLKGGADVKAAIHAAIYLEGSTTAAHEADFNVKVKAVALRTLSEIYEVGSDGNAVVKDGESVSFKAYYIGMYPKQGAIVGTGKYAMLAFGVTDLAGIEVGDAVSVSGTVKDYSGLRELNNGSTITKLNVVPEDLAQPETLTMDATTVRAFKFGDDNRPVEVKGAKVTKAKLSDSGNLTVNLDLNGTAITAFMNATYSANVINTWYPRTDKDGNPALVEAGDIVNFTGYVAAYNAAYQIVYGKVTKWTVPEVSASCSASSLAVSDTATINISKKDDTVTIASTTFASSDSTIATVDEEGVVTGVKAGDVTITATIVVGETSYREEVKITIFAINPVAKTVAEILAMDLSGLSQYAYDQDHVYSVTGILEGLSSSDKYGNAYLTDAATGKTVKIYGLSGRKFAGISYKDGKYSYSNPKDAKTTLADVKNGQKVTLNVMVENAGGGVANICGYVVSHEDTDAKYASTINTPENGTASLSITESSAYGTEIKVTATPNEGYKVDTVVLKTSYATTNLTAAADGTYAYKVTCKNDVTVTFKTDAKPTSGSEVVDTWTCESDSAGFPTATSDDVSSFTATFSTAGAIAMSGQQFKTISGGMFLTKDKGFIYNTAPIPGTIKSVKLTTTASAAKGAQYAVTFGTSAQSTLSNSSAVNVGKGASGTYACSADAAKYFQVAVDAAGNGQVASLEITYIAD